MSTPHEKASSTALSPRTLGVVALIAVGASGALVSPLDFCLDDSWIHLAYARSLQLGEGLSYNPGDNETGFSSPLWVVLLALLPPGEHLVVQVKLLGVLLHGLSACAAALLAHTMASRVLRMAGRPVHLAQWGAFLAGTLTALLGHLLQSATSGMEASLATLLILAVALSSSHERGGVWTFALAWLGVLARPETLFFSGTLGAMLWLQQRRARALAALLGAAAALLAWVLYCLSVSGHPWPNTRYVKAATDPLTGLAYLVLEVLLQRPWVLGVSGLVVLGLVLARRRGPLHALMLAWLVTVVGISLTREVTPGALFFHYRYFVIVAPVPIVAFCVALTTIERSWLRWACATPVAIISLLQWPQVKALQSATEQDIHQLHTVPAQHLARELQPGAVVLVEGAGAMRYWMPRSVRVVDMVGLNHRAIAHAVSPLHQGCLLIGERPTHAAVPDEWMPTVSTLFALEPLGAFVDDRHHSGRRVFKRQLHILQVLGPKPQAVAACNQALDGPRGSPADPGAPADTSDAIR